MSTRSMEAVNWNRIKASAKAAVQAEWDASPKVSTWEAWPNIDTLRESIMSLATLWHICTSRCMSAGTATAAEPARQDLARWYDAANDLHTVLFEEMGGDEDYDLLIDETLS